jgi:hypothetical protein
MADTPHRLITAGSEGSRRCPQRRRERSDRNAFVPLRGADCIPPLLRLRKLLALVIRQLVQKGRVDLQQCFVDATFAAAKGGGAGVGLTRKGKGTKIQLVVDAKGIPLAVSLDAADRAESHMVQQTLAWEETDAQPERLIGDKAYDSDALDDALAELGIEMISPHRRNRMPENQT